MEKVVQGILTNIVKWAPFGVGIGVTAHSIQAGEWTQAVLLSFLTACSSIWVKFSGKFMEEAGKEAEARGGGLAKWMFAMGDHAANSLKGTAVKAWLQRTSDFEDKYFQRLIYICRNFETQGLDKDQVLKLQQVFVPLKISQKSLAKISPDLIQRLPEKLTKQQDIGELLVWMSQDPTLRRLAILGAPGSGKTTLLRYLTLIYATRRERKTLHVKAPKFIPVLFYLRNVREDIINNPNLSLAELIDAWIERLQTIDPLDPPTDWFANKLKRNECLILLDGLDEIADEQERFQVSQWVDRQMHEYLETAFILTSRPLGYQDAQLQQDVTVLEVQPFTLKQVQQFIHSWYLETEIRSQGNNDDLGVREEAKQQADDLIERIRHNPPLAAMAVNPLLLTMISTVHRRGSALPGKRVELYKEICQVLLDKRQRAKRIPDLLTASQKQSVLQILALDLMNRKTRSFKPSEVNVLLRKRLAAFASDALTSNEFLKQTREVGGLLIVKEERFYEFVHLSFQEYLASVEIRDCQQEQLLVNAFRAPQQLSWWAETIRLYAAQGDASAVIQAAMQVSTVDALALAFDCLEEGKSIAPTIRQALENLLEKGLEDR